MVSEDIDLYQEAPRLGIDGSRQKSGRSRNQLVLDFSREEVVDEIYDPDLQGVGSG